MKGRSVEKLSRASIREQEIVSYHKERADDGSFDGTDSYLNKIYMHMCRSVIVDAGIQICFTRNEGMPYAWVGVRSIKAYHLSMAMFVPGENTHLPFNEEVGRHWARLFYGGNEDKILVRQPDTSEGKAADVRHYFLFCNADWQPVAISRNTYLPDGWQFFNLN